MTAAATINTFGQGQAYYLATELDNAALGSFLQKLCADKGLTSPLPGGPPPGIEVMPRVSPSDETLLYVLNHHSESVFIPLPPGSFRDLLSDAVHHDRAQLTPYDVLILTAENES